MSDKTYRTLDYDCGISMSRIACWLSDELNLAYENDVYTFAFNDCSCEVKLSRLSKRTLGVVSIERAHLHIEGEKDAVDELERLFTLRFMSAGG